MYLQAYLVACYILGTQYHSGQFSKGYSLQCMVDEYVRREYPGWNISRTMEHLDMHTLYGKHSSFRNAVAYCLFRMRKHRSEL